MGKIVTIVEARVEAQFHRELVEEYNSHSDVPDGLVASSLQQNKADPELWQIVTIWENTEKLERMRSQARIPAAIAVFKKFLAEPKLDIFMVEAEK